MLQTLFLLQSKKSNTNFDRIIGETGIVTEEINNIVDNKKIKPLSRIYSLLNFLIIITYKIFVINSI